MGVFTAAEALNRTKNLPISIAYLASLLWGSTTLLGLQVAAQPTHNRPEFWGSELWPLHL